MEVANEVVFVVIVQCHEGAPHDNVLHLINGVTKLLELKGGRGRGGGGGGGGRGGGGGGGGGGRVRVKSWEIHVQKRRKK